MPVDKLDPDLFLMDMNGQCFGLASPDPPQQLQLGDCKAEIFLSLDLRLSQQ
jgi:hypothetical protein